MVHESFFMPVTEVHSPYFDKLPKTLFNGAFVLWLAPGGEYEWGRPWGYYFHDRTWWANGAEILGWAREILHTLDIKSWTRTIWADSKLDWLCGHGFRRRVDTYHPYTLSASRDIFSESHLIELSHIAIDALGEADITRDCWAGSEHRHWFSAIRKHLSEGANADDDFLQSHIERHGILDAFIRMENRHNRAWHRQYPPNGAQNVSGIGQTYCNGILNAAFQATTFTGAATIYCFLHSANPSDTSMGTVAAYTGFAPQAITCNSTNFPAAAAGAITYANAITFPTNTGASETETAVSWAAASSGNTQPNWWGTLSSSVAVGTGIAPQFNANAVTTSGS